MEIFQEIYLPIYLNKLFFSSSSKLHTKFKAYRNEKKKMTKNISPPLHISQTCSFSLITSKLPVHF